MANVTYLLGAGASAGVLPVVKRFPERLEAFRKVVEDSKYILSNTERFRELNNGHNKRELQSMLIKSINELVQNILNHASIDTYAKKLATLRKNNELLDLKCILIIFFLFEQNKNSNERFDRRYDSFIASLINHKTQLLPKHVKILTWNYDFQIELAYSKYSDEKDIYSIQRTLNVFPNVNPNPVNEFSIYKLNGTTTIYNSNDRSFTYLIDQCPQNINKDLVEYLVFVFFKIWELGKESVILDYAWEENNIAIETKGNAIEATKNTNILVVIGYSFPFFNREIDRQIIRHMINLKKVYFQAPSEDVEKHKIRFQSILSEPNDIEKVLYKDIEEFFLPPEL